MIFRIVEDHAYSQGWPCFCRALFESWCVTYDNIFYFKTKCLGGQGSKVTF